MVSINVGNVFISGDTAYKIIEIKDNKVIATVFGTNITKEFDLSGFRRIEDVPEHELD